MRNALESKRLVYVLRILKTPIRLSCMFSMFRSDDMPHDVKQAAVQAVIEEWKRVKEILEIPDYSDENGLDFYFKKFKTPNELLKFLNDLVIPRDKRRCILPSLNHCLDGCLFYVVGHRLVI